MIHSTGHKLVAISKEHQITTIVPLADLMDTIGRHFQRTSNHNTLQERGWIELLVAISKEHQITTPPANGVSGH